jgi:hypothetical protein
MAGIRQRQSQNMNSSAFAERVKQDIILEGEKKKEPKTHPSEMSLRARILIFLAFPMIIGSAGLCLGYFLTLHDKSRNVDFDQDFIFPFLMAVALAVVIAIQTKGFTGPMKPLVRWPKARRRKKIIRKRVIVDDNGNLISPKED